MPSLNPVLNKIKGRKTRVLRGNVLMFRNLARALFLACSIFLHVETATGGVLKQGVLKIFTKLTGKHLCWSLFLIKFEVSGLFEVSFPVNFGNFF